MLKLWLNVVPNARKEVIDNMKVSISGGSNFDKTLKELSNLDSAIDSVKHGLGSTAQTTVAKLANATPVRSGRTRASWSQETEINQNGAEVTFYNSNLTRSSVPVAILLDKGHYTGTGGYVPPQNFIEPIMKNMAQQVADEAERRLISGK